MTRFYCRSCRYSSDWSSHLQNPTLKCCITYYNYTTGKNNPCNRLPLYDAINNRAPDAVILTLLEENKAAAKVCDCIGKDLPIHKAIENKYSDIVILVLLKENKEAVKACKGNGYLLLHLAIQAQASEEIVMKLFQENENAATKLCDGILPLHLALDKNYSDSIYLCSFHGKQTSSFRIK